MFRSFLIVVLTCLSVSTWADSILIENVRIFNGVDATLTPGHVLVEDGVISRVSGKVIVAGDDTVVIDGNNRVLSPGFIDLHVHLTMHVPFAQGDVDRTGHGVWTQSVSVRRNTFSDGRSWRLAAFIRTKPNTGRQRSLHLRWAGRHCRRC